MAEGRRWKPKFVRKKSYHVGFDFHAERIVMPSAELRVKAGCQQVSGEKWFTDCKAPASKALLEMKKIYGKRICSNGIV